MRRKCTLAGSQEEEGAAETRGASGIRMPMGKINVANLKKTLYYLKRNGLKATWYAMQERLAPVRPYTFQAAPQKELEAQRSWAVDKNLRFSIVVPAYRTDKRYLRELIQSVAEQTYPHWELILADATEDESVRSAVEQIAEELSFGRAAGEGEGGLKDGKAAEAASSQACTGNQKVWKARGGQLRYSKLPSNEGISANTNRALQYAAGDYVGLLDHDDLLTPNALYEMAFRIEEAGQQGRQLAFLYSDEDKCSGDGSHFYEPHRKEDFNFDLLLSNNYICHFLVMKRELIQELGLRPAYDGAQDYDLVLRAVGKLLAADGSSQDVGEPDGFGIVEDKSVSPGLVQAGARGRIAHIPKVLYHWRCHTGSTAENPQSKQYAYEAGLKALQDFADSQGYEAEAVHLKHLGFYRLEYKKDMLESRAELGAVGGRILGRLDRTFPEKDGPTAVIGAAAENSPTAVTGTAAGNGQTAVTGTAAGNGPMAVIGTAAGNSPMADTVPRASGNGLCIIGGRMSSEGDVYYEGLAAGYSGPFHRAVLTQTAEALDIRCIRLRRECRELFEKVVGVPYRERETADHSLIFDVSALPEEANDQKLSLALCRALREAGYSLCYDPRLEVVWKESP